MDIQTQTTYSYISSPIGTLLATRAGEAITSLHFEKSSSPADPQPDWLKSDDAFDDLREQLAAYFAGPLREFDLLLRPEGTQFQQEVWAALQRIPYGETTSYARIAAAIDRPAAVRAVGAANGANPIPLIIPCHRVIGRDGSLTGFGGGLPVKRFLLDLERGAAPPLRLRLSP